MHIRTASLADAAALAAVEAACFPPAEAATAAEITDRLAYYADHFWLLEEDDGTLVSFVDGMPPTSPRSGTRCMKTPPSTTRTAPGR